MSVIKVTNILQQNGLGSGGLNFDAKVRRSSTDPVDLFHAHIGGMDAFARALIIAQRIIDDKVLSGFVAERYSSFNGDIGSRIMSGKTGLADIDTWILAQPFPTLQSGRQEMLENILNDYLQ